MQNIPLGIQEKSNNLLLTLTPMGGGVDSTPPTVIRKFHQIQLNKYTSIVVDFSYLYIEGSPLRRLRKY